MSAIRMAYFLGCYLCLLSLMPGGNWQDLSRSKEIAEHFREHYTTFTLQHAQDFVWQHYVSDHKSKDSQKHRQLPFFRVSKQYCYVFQQLTVRTLARYFLMGDNAKNDGYSFGYDFLVTQQGWHPPQLQAN